MSLSLIILGSTRAIGLQRNNIDRLVVKYGLNPVDEDSITKKIWETPGQPAPYLMCAHFTIPGAEEMGGATDTNVKRFMVEVMKLPGVYSSCPECSKRRHWKKNEQAQGATVPAEA